MTEQAMSEQAMTEQEGGVPAKDSSQGSPAGPRTEAYRGERYRQPKCDAVLAYCALPMGHAGTHAYPTASLGAVAAPEVGADPLTETVVQNALDEAWLESGDARGQSRPPDLARHLYDALRDYASLDGSEVGADEEQHAQSALPLDVERLAKALCGTAEPQPSYGFVDDECRARAHEVAAEYARNEQHAHEGGSAPPEPER